MSLGAQLPIRLELDVQERLEAIAQEIGTSKSALLRLLAKTFVEQVNASHGVVRLPPNWKELFERLPAADKRSSPAPRNPRSARLGGRRARSGAAASPASSKPASAAAKLLGRHVPSAPGRGGE